MPGNPFLDFLDDVEVQALFALEFVGAVAGADRGRERIAAGLLHEFDRLFRIGQGSVAFVDLNVFLDPAELAEFRLDADPLLMRALDDPFGDGDVFLE